MSEGVQLLRADVLKEMVGRFAHGATAGREQHLAGPLAAFRGVGRIRFLERTQQLRQARAAEAHLTQLVGQVAAQADVPGVQALQDDSLQPPLRVALQQLEHFAARRRHGGRWSHSSASGPAGRASQHRLAGTRGQLLRLRLVLLQHLLQPDHHLPDRFLRAGQPVLRLLDQVRAARPASGPTRPPAGRRLRHPRVSPVGSLVGLPVSVSSSTFPRMSSSRQTASATVVRAPAWHRAGEGR